MERTGRKGHKLPIEKHEEKPAEKPVGSLEKDVFEIKGKVKEASQLPTKGFGAMDAMTGKRTMLKGVSSLKERVIEDYNPSQAVASTHPNLASYNKDLQEFSKALDDENFKSAVPDKNIQSAMRDRIQKADDAQRRLMFLLETIDSSNDRQAAVLKATNNPSFSQDLARVTLDATQTGRDWKKTVGDPRKNDEISEEFKDEHKDLIKKYDFDPSRAIFGFALQYSSEMKKYTEESPEAQKEDAEKAKAQIKKVDQSIDDGIRNQIVAPLTADQKKGIENISTAAGVDKLPLDALDALGIAFAGSKELLPAVNTYLDTLKTNDIEKIALAAAPIDEALAGIGPAVFNKASGLFRVLMEKNVTMGNLQFNTDTLMGLFYAKDKYPEGSKIGRYYKSDQTQKLLQGPAPESMGTTVHEAVKSQIERGRRFVPGVTDAEWTVPSTVPGVGPITHAGWKDISLADTGKEPKIFKATRTIGLMEGDKHAISAIPLDFSALGAIDRDTAKKLLEITTSVAEAVADHKFDPEEEFQKAFEQSGLTTNEEKIKEIVMDFATKMISEPTHLHSLLNKPQKFGKVAG